MVLTTDTIKALVNARVVNPIDYCNDYETLGILLFIAGLGR